MEIETAWPWSLRPCPALSERGDFSAFWRNDILWGWMETEAGDSIDPLSTDPDLGEQSKMESRFDDRLEDMFAFKANDGEDKVMDLEKAIERHVRPGMSLFSPPRGVLPYAS